MSFPNYLKKYLINESDWVSVSKTIYGQKNRVFEQKADAKEKRLTLILISGLSGAGKDSIVAGMIKKDRRFGWVKTCTTRGRRPEENDENDSYIRISKDRFIEAVKGSDVIEWVEYAGNYYCSLSSVFNKALESYEYPVLRIDPAGLKFYSDLWKNNGAFFDKVNLISFFIVPPSMKTLRNRLLTRSNNPQFVKDRLLQMKHDIRFLVESEYIAINKTGHLNKTVDDIVKTILG